MSELKQEAMRRGLVASIGESTIWRWLSEDAIRPWHHRSWIFPRDPAFADKAGRILDLYAGLWKGHPLGSNDFVISADEKTSVQARRRKHRGSPLSPVGLCVSSTSTCARELGPMKDGRRGTREETARESPHGLAPGVRTFAVRSLRQDPCQSEVRAWRELPAYRTEA